MARLLPRLALFACCQDCPKGKLLPIVGFQLPFELAFCQSLLESKWRRLLLDKQGLPAARPVKRQALVSCCLSKLPHWHLVWQGRPSHAIAFIQKGHCIFCCLLWLPWYTLPLSTGMWQQALPATRATQKAGLCILLPLSKSGSCPIEQQFIP